MVTNFTTGCNTQKFWVLPIGVFMCFVWIWEQTAIISLYSINWLVFITEMECVYCAVRTGSLYIILRSAHTVCFVWIWEQTAIISLYSINWLVFITETGCVYCAVRTGSLYTASLTFSNSSFCPHSVFMCFVWIWEQTAIISLYNINWLVFITETECLLRGTDWIFTYNCIIWHGPRAERVNAAVCRNVCVICCWPNRVFVGRDCCQRTATAANFLCTFNYRARVIDATFECVAFC